MSELQAARRILDDAGEGVRRMIRAFHGSPSPEHFDSFDPRYIGTGEGAQAYGYGHYSAQNKDVADEYRRNLSYRKLRDDFLNQLDERSEPEEVMDVIDSFDPRQQQFLRQLSEEDWLGFDYPSQAISQALGRKSGFAGYDVAEEAQRAREQMGTGYEIEIGYPEESLLDWDAPVDVQDGGVINALQSLGVEIYRPSGSGMRPGGLLGTRGESAYKQLSSMLPEGEVDASRALLEAGIPGIRYLDGSSRRAGEGSRNYVMFPGTEDRIRILRKYGLAPATLGAEGLLNQQPEESMAPGGVPVRQ